MNALSQIRKFFQGDRLAGDVIIRRMRVNRSRSPQEALAATGRKQYVTDAVVAHMPRGEGDEAEIFFFKVGRWISDDDLEKEYSSRGLVPADPFSLAAVNEADPAFADTDGEVDPRQADAIPSTKGVL